MQLLKTSRNIVWLLAVAGAVASCNVFKKKHDKSTATGWNYNDKDQGNFNVSKPKDIKAAPGLVFVQGGTFTMGATQEDVMGDWNNIQRRITVNSFFIDKTEVANVHYREYLYWLDNVFGQAGMDSIVEQAKPDTLVWRSELAYNEPYVEYYFRHPSYNYYPVVGVNWKQATDYCIWRTDRVNELTLMGKGYLDKKSQIKRELNGSGQDNFNTKAYLMDEYQATPGREAASKKNPLKDAQGRPRTKVNFEDGILYGDYRLPTEAEWEYAAYGYIAENPQKKQKGAKRGEELIANKQIYSWKNNGYDNSRYTQKGGYQGAFLANFKRGSGDNMGVAGGLNDNAAIPAEVTSFMPNGYGLYNMSGNVSEWVADVYRPMNTIDNDDFNPFRGNEFKKVDMSGGQGNLRDDKGRIKMIPEDDSALRNRRNYQRSYATNYLDGDSSSNVYYGYGVTTLISDKSRVYKGGSWNDRAYWLSPGSRRFLEEDQSTNTLGFRCAMTHYGAAEGTSRKAQTGQFIPQRRNKR
ncbi:SUMF1/EgtB/PvdO family nonheme iron enzyme [Sediminibacterium ginsengisoli]|uniref:Gliding motility-associated lipoprotein GldJ/gliding motility-associated lipoprotein GldJ,TIGR03530 n=1 Tax=Sediminibacterium ginsengisoli TaxID=413434 RepID=A0A1T4N682_9BACT|nr:SUMF1/EgtB/PvdO family nonheme iron enzyme [Sediminibacterium ginsengisoli]SJZ74605.1 gliding motility-associated lipoprotein GldJ/gliding motility-associated lipoprotein GldJ,TIGR03530 [Sediminibacterium ginsengisoli]